MQSFGLPSFLFRCLCETHFLQKSCCDPDQWRFNRNPVLKHLSDDEKPSTQLWIAVMAALSYFSKQSWAGWISVEFVGYWYDGIFSCFCSFFWTVIEMNASFWKVSMNSSLRYVTVFNQKSGISPPPPFNFFSCKTFFFWITEWIFNNKICLRSLITGIQAVNDREMLSYLCDGRLTGWQKPLTASNQISTQFEWYRITLLNWHGDACIISGGFTVH